MTTLLNGSLVLICSEGKSEQIYQLAAQAFNGNGDFNGFQIQTMSQDGSPSHPWHLPKQKLIIVGFTGELPDWFVSDPINSTVLVSRWPPMVTGNDILLWGLESFRHTALTVEKSNLLVMEHAA